MKLRANDLRYLNNLLGGALRVGAATIIAFTSGFALIGFPTIGWLSAAIGIAAASLIIAFGPLPESIRNAERRVSIRLIRASVLTLGVATIVPRLDRRLSEFDLGPANPTSLPLNLDTTLWIPGTYEFRLRHQKKIGNQSFPLMRADFNKTQIAGEIWRSKADDKVERIRDIRNSIRLSTSSTENRVDLIYGKFQIHYPSRCEFRVTELSIPDALNDREPTFVVRRSYDDKGLMMSQAIFFMLTTLVSIVFLVASVFFLIPGRASYAQPRASSETSQTLHRSNNR